MNQIDLSRRVRVHTRDFADTVFRGQDILDYLNEGIERARQLVPEFHGMKVLDHRQAEVTHMPEAFQHLLALYAASRCLTQDERHFQAGTFMNEFEQKMDDLKHAIQWGEVAVYDVRGNRVTHTADAHYVRNTYFSKRSGHVDVDEGVEGV